MLLMLLLQAIVHLISKRFAISIEAATIIYNNEDYHKLGQLGLATPYSAIAIIIILSLL